VKRIVHSMLGFKSCWAARCMIAGMTFMPAMRTGPLRSTGEEQHARRTILYLGRVNNKQYLSFLFPSKKLRHHHVIHSQNIVNVCSDPQYRKHEIPLFL